MDCRGSGVMNRIRIGSHTASDVRKNRLSRALDPYPANLATSGNANPHVEVAREEPVVDDGLSQSRSHESHRTIPAATEPTSDD